MNLWYQRGILTAITGNYHVESESAMDYDSQPRNLLIRVPINH